jgi:hypothetical protein
MSQPPRTTTVAVTVTLTLEWDEEALEDLGTQPIDYKHDLGQVAKTAKDAVLDQLIEDNGLPVMVKHQGAGVTWEPL